jgi:DNA-binding NarL/FixJ family response regulator
MKRVLLVEDHVGFREALAHIFKWETGIEDDVQATSVSESRRRIGSLDGVDVAVVDLGLPDGNGEDLIRELRASDPNVSVLVLTKSTDPERHARALEAGAEKVMTKTCALDEIVEAVRKLGGV